jgi:hypothetical protein
MKPASAGFYEGSSPRVEGVGIDNTSESANEGGAARSTAGDGRHFEQPGNRSEKKIVETKKKKPMRLLLTRRLSRFWTFSLSPTIGPLL